MYDGEHLRLRLTDAVRLSRQSGRWMAQISINGQSGIVELPAGLVPRGTPAVIAPDSTLARVILGLTVEAERHCIVFRELDDTDVIVEVEG